MNSVQLDMEAFSGDVARHPSPAYLNAYVLACDVVAAPLSSGVAGIAVFLLLVLSQRRDSRYGSRRVDTSRSLRRGRGQRMRDSVTGVVDASDEVSMKR